MVDNIIFLLSHPKDALRAWHRQQMVKIEHEVAPPGTIIEEFEAAPLREAAKQMGLGKTIRSDGGNPEHPNV